MYLAHHGIKGMRWGIRRYQNKDGTLTPLGRERYSQAIKEMSKRARGTGYVSPIQKDDEKAAALSDKTGVIQKGTKLYRTTSRDERIDESRKYVSLTEYGKRSYQSSYVSGTIGKNNQEDPVTITYSAAKDLKVATSKEVEEFITSLYPDKTKMSVILKDVRSLQDGMNWSYPQNKEEQAAYRYVQKGESFLTQRFNETLYKEKYGSVVFDHFSKLGYDAISDVEDGGLSSDYAPAIILNPKKALKEIKREDVYN